MKKYITLAIVLAASLVLAASPPIGTSQLKFPIGTLHGAAAETVDFGSALYGSDWARFVFQADTIAETVPYYKLGLQVKPFAGSAWSASIAFTDSITFNHESGTTTSQYTTDTMPGGLKWVQLVGVYPYSRLIVTPTLVVGARGMKNCTLWVHRYKR